jgi:hypothetical protein
MKKGLLFVLLFVSIAVYGNSNDSLKIVTLQREVSNMKTTVSRLQQENGKIRGLYQKQKSDFDSLLLCQKQQTEDLQALAEKMGVGLSETNKSIQSSTNSLSSIINTRTWLAVCGILIAIALLGVVYYILRKRIISGSSAVEKIKSAQESLESAHKAMQEESVKLDSKLVELLDKQLIQPHDNVEEDHKLVLSIATEVARIEQNLAFMDPKTKGVSNLKNRASAIKTTLQSRGYDIPTLIGETYHEGDNMKPTMELDEELPVGTQIIRRVMKPMVLFKGKLIQAAEVVVAYNE